MCSGFFTCSISSVGYNTSLYTPKPMNPKTKNTGKIKTSNLPQYTFLFDTLFIMCPLYHFQVKKACILFGNVIYFSCRKKFLRGFYPEKGGVVLISTTGGKRIFPSFFVSTIRHNFKNKHDILFMVML